MTGWSGMGLSPNTAGVLNVIQNGSVDIDTVAFCAVQSCRFHLDEQCLEHVAELGQPDTRILRRCPLPQVLMIQQPGNFLLRGGQSSTFHVVASCPGMRTYNNATVNSIPASP